MFTTKFLRVSLFSVSFGVSACFGASTKRNNDAESSFKNNLSVRTIEIRCRPNASSKRTRRSSCNCASACIHVYVNLFDSSNNEQQSVTHLRSTLRVSFRSTPNCTIMHGSFNGNLRTNFSHD